MPPIRTCHQKSRKRTKSDKRSKVEHKEKKRKLKIGSLNGRKEGGQQGGGKDRNTELCRGGYLDPEAIWLSCSVIQLVKNLPWTQPDPLSLSLSVSVFFPLIHGPKSSECKHITAFCTSDGLWPDSVCGQHLALGWPFAVDGHGASRAKAGRKPLPYHTQSPGLCHSFLLLFIGR